MQDAEPASTWSSTPGRQRPREGRRNRGRNNTEKRQTRKNRREGRGLTRAPREGGTECHALRTGENESGRREKGETGRGETKLRERLEDWRTGKEDKGKGRGEEGERLLREDAVYFFNPPHILMSGIAYMCIRSYQQTKSGKT